MAHECPECAAKCFCDGEDVMHENVIVCDHSCPIDPDDYDDRSDDFIEGWPV